MFISEEKLIFGDSNATYSDNIIILASQLSKVVPSLQDMSPLGSKNNFIAKNTSLVINDLKMNAHILSAVKIESKESDDIALMIPIFGNCTTIVEKKKYTWREGSFAYLKPKLAGQSFTDDIRQSVVINLIPQKLLEQMRIMLGIEETEPFYFDFDRPRLIPLFYKNISFQPIFLEFFETIERYYQHMEDLEKIKFDILLYRFIVMFLFPEKFFEENLNSTRLDSHSYSTFKLLEQIKDESFVAFMNLSDLERFTKLSTRSLQLIFKKNFGMTPSQFLREQKLKFARNMLLDKDNSMNVTQVALEIGCINFSQFSKYYKEHFGELPSETRKKIY